MGGRSKADFPGVIQAGGQEKFQCMASQGLQYLVKFGLKLYLHKIKEKAMNNYMIAVLDMNVARRVFAANPIHPHKIGKFQAFPIELSLYCAFQEKYPLADTADNAPCPPP